jgi:FSR family fosmidomycin resistance protein-like MFS transporter
MKGMPPGKTDHSAAVRRDHPVGSFQTGPVVALSICHFIHDIYSSFLAPLLPLLIKKLSLSLTEAGFLSTAMQLPSLLNPYLGTLADRISVRYFIILAPGMTAVSMSLIGMAPNYGVLLLLLLTAGFSVAIFHVPAPVMVARLSGGKKGRGMSFFMTGGELARSLGPLAAVGAVSLTGLEGFYPVMLVGILASLWLFWRFKDIPIRTDPTKRTSVFGTWREMRHILRPLSAILLFRGFMHAAITAFLPTFITQQTGKLWLAGVGLTIFEAAGVAGVLAAGSLSDTLGRRRILVLSLLGAPASLFVFTTIGGLIGLAALVLSGFTLLSTTPVMLALVQEHAESSPSAANGIFMMISFVARSAVVVVVGFVADQIGLTSTYLLSAALGLAAIPFVLRLPRG